MHRDREEQRDAEQMGARGGKSLKEGTKLDAEGVRGGRRWTESDRGRQRGTKWTERDRGGQRDKRGQRDKSGSDGT